MNGKNNICSNYLNLKPIAYFLINFITHFCFSVSLKINGKKHNVVSNKITDSYFQAMNVIYDRHSSCATSPKTRE